MSLRRIGELAIGFVIIGGCWAAGELLSRVAHLPLPGSVVGMLVLAGVLRARVIPLAAVHPAAELLIRWMALFFVPAGVAVVLYFPLLRANLAAIVVAALGSIVAVLLVTGLLMERMARDD